MNRVAALAVLFGAGCSGKPEPTAPDTGARATAEEFYRALIANDPLRAYATLDPDSRRRVPADQFPTLSRAYSKKIGFPAERVNVHASEEQGDTATAHVTLVGHPDGHSRRYSDGITLRRTEGRWGIVLPVNFGQKTR